MQTIWLSIHIFHKGALNDVLQQLVIPFLEEVKPLLYEPAPYFFIRYGEGGPHIRLRLQTATENITTLKVVLNRYEHDFTIQYIPYVQELSRYENMQLAEQHFHLSSAYVLSVLTDEAFTEAVKLNVTMLYGLPDALLICREFVQSWLPRVHEPNFHLSLFEEHFSKYEDILLPAIERHCAELDAGKAGPLLQQYVNAQTEILTAYYRSVERSRMRSVIRSLLHMQHNRLGIPNRDESCMMYFTQKCLEYVTYRGSCI
ncbi:thiopeptide-type bacteriocin biosynthesis protein [Chitinophaga tropicalis]|uniref:Thiopeptide-type bacteriocin biosynthesis domain-containing protein n=1 Tax=Chitinophaga tropicalis TaxID=2683588 RepID=A0A7K1U897_9BACT|nr:thiopeptide-type bacteriocin biosynthesis protein [Chitinophaga tropicalis]MVT10604.1 hypothetical protein [Chitinophaga tropicalis]